MKQVIFVFGFLITSLIAYSQGGVGSVGGATIDTTTKIETRSHTAATYKQKGDSINVDGYATVYDVSLKADQTWADTVKGDNEVTNEITAAIEGVEGLDPDEVLDSIKNAPFPYTYVIQELAGTIYAVPEKNSGYEHFHDTNITSVLNNAIGELTNGGKIFIRKGTYDYIYESITIDYDNIIIEGEGKFSTILKFKEDVDAVRSMPMIYCGGTDGFELRNVGLDGYGAEQTFIDNGASETARCLGFYAYDSATFSATTNIIIDNCYIYDFTSIGVYFSYASDCKVINSILKDTYWGQFGTGSETNNIIIDNCIFGGGGNGEVTFHNGYGNKLLNSYFYDTDGTHGTAEGQYSITLEGTGVGPTAITIENNIIDAPTTHMGIYALSASNNCVIKDNLIYNVGVQDASVIKMNNDTNTVITGNKIYDVAGTYMPAIWLYNSRRALVTNNYISADVYYGIYLSNGSSYNTIMGNFIYGSNMGVNITSGANYNRIIENDFDTAADDVADAGTGTIFGNNIWNDGTYDNSAP